MFALAVEEIHGGDHRKRIRHHLLAEFGQERFAALTLKRLQALLSAKAATYSRSVVAHLRWDMRAIFKLAMAEGYIQRDPTSALFTPKEEKVAARRVMNPKEAEQFIAAMDIRERVICASGDIGRHAARGNSGLAAQAYISDCGEVVIEQRLYRGDIDAPKTESSKRIVALPPIPPPSCGNEWNW